MKDKKVSRLLRSTSDRERRLTDRMRGRVICNGFSLEPANFRFQPSLWSKRANALGYVYIYMSLAAPNVDVCQFIDYREFLVPTHSCSLLVRRAVCRRRRCSGSAKVRKVRASSSLTSVAAASARFRAISRICRFDSSRWERWTIGDAEETQPGCRVCTRAISPPSSFSFPLLPGVYQTESSWCTIITANDFRMNGCFRGRVPSIASSVSYIETQFQSLDQWTRFPFAKTFSAERLIARGSSVTSPSQNFPGEFEAGFCGGKKYVNFSRERSRISRRAGGKREREKEGIGLTLRVPVKKRSFRARIDERARDMHLINNEISVFSHSSGWPGFCRSTAEHGRYDKYRNIDISLPMCFTGIFGNSHGQCRDPWESNFRRSARRNSSNLERWFHGSGNESREFILPI